MRAFLRDPLTHFILLGCAVFAIHGWWTQEQGSPEEAPRLIVVDEASLLEFMQYRARAFDAESFRAQLEAMAPEERQRLIDDFIREEALFREAKSSGLDEDDYMIRRRLVQKVEFITESVARHASSISDDELNAYFRAHQDRYRVEPSATFTHVFFDADLRDWEESRRMAASKLLTLNETNAAFADSVNHGDRFPFHVNYVERTPEFVASHFGGSFSDTVFSLAPDDAQWYGPFESTYGVHLVMLTQRMEGREAELADVLGRVREDAEFEKKNEALREAVGGLVEQYDVRVTYTPGKLP